MLSVKAANGFQVGGTSLFNGVVSAQIELLPKVRSLSLVSSFVGVNAANAKNAFPIGAVHRVNTPVGFPQIVDAIVPRLPINMVNQLWRLLSVIERPRNAMSKIHRPTKLNVAVAQLVNSTSFGTYDAARARFGDPDKGASSRIIRKVLGKFFNVHAHNIHEIWNRAERGQK